MVWECSSCLKCECGTLSRPSQTRTKLTKMSFQKALHSTDHRVVVELWPKIVDAYALRQLTKREDLLPALSGLAKQFQSCGTGEYYAGLWLESLPISLLWEARGVRASPYRAPTWSWASIDTSISDSTLISTWEGHQSDLICSTIKIVSCTPQTSDPTGRVAAGQLTISGKVLEINVRPAHMSKVTVRDMSGISSMLGTILILAGSSQAERGISWLDSMPTQYSPIRKIFFACSLPKYQRAELLVRLFFIRLLRMRRRFMGESDLWIESFWGKA